MIHGFGLHTNTAPPKMLFLLYGISRGFSLFYRSSRLLLFFRTTTSSLPCILIFSLCCYLQAHGCTVRGQQDATESRETEESISLSYLKTSILPVSPPIYSITSTHSSFTIVHFAHLFSWHGFHDTESTYTRPIQLNIVGCCFFLSPRTYSREGQGRSIPG